MSVLNRLFAKALSLEVGGQEVLFRGPGEFEFALNSRTDLPARKLTDLLALGADELKQEAQSIKQVEQRLVDILAKTIEVPGAITDFMRTADPLIFSQDHQWRDIVRALNEKGTDYDELRKIAFVKYMQYLRSRQDVIKQIYKLKKRTAQPAPAPVTARVEDITESLSLPNNADADATFEIPSYLRDTLIFDSVILDSPALGESEFTRLLKGEGTTVSVATGSALQMRLAAHHFVLQMGPPLILIDDQARRWVLGTARNLIGRDAMCNAVLENDWRDISRVHCVIEPLGGSHLRITDLSAHGTFVPVANLVAS